MEAGELGADLDVRDFFENVSHERLVKFVEHWVADRRILRLDPEGGSFGRRNGGKRRWGRRKRR
jgi:hypothetical protein